MAAIWKTARVFISSTFRDMHAERDHLVKVVFPRLRERLEPHRIYLDDVDLRWGVTKEQAESGRALDLCLHTIDECRPFFVGILGERYGSVAADLPDETLARYGWVREHAGRSLTELEIIHAVLRDTKMKARAFFYFRDPAALRDVPSNRRADYNEADPAQVRKLDELKDRIRQIGQPVFDGYPARWKNDVYDRSTKAVGRLGDLAVFGDRVHDELWDAISLEFGLTETPAGTVPNFLAEEDEGHERFMESRVRVYVGREGLNEALLNFAEGDEPRPCLLIGPAGSGKSAALARLVLDFRRRHPQATVIAHFVGATSRSTSYREMLGRFARELYESVLKEQKAARLAQVSTEGETGFRRERIEKEYAIPEDGSALSSTLRRFLLKIPADRRVLIVMDALDQLDLGSFNEAFAWLPDPLPSQIRLIVSKKGDTEAAEIFGPRQHQLVQVDPLAEGERAEIIRQVPSLSAKTLDEQQVGLLLDNPACANPLFLRVAIEELRGTGSFDQLTRRIKSFPGRNPGLFERLSRAPWSRSRSLTREPVTDLFGQVLDRLETEFDTQVVQAALTNLAVARRGLSEGELREIVSDRSGADDLFTILRQLRPYLLNSAGLLNFYHRNLEFAVTARYLDSDAKRSMAHSKLADYFSGQPYFLPGRMANARKADELPWQLLQAARWKDLEKLLVTLEFCEAKAEAGLVSDLADDFTSTLSALPGEPPRRPRWDEPRSLAETLETPSDPFPMRPILRLLEEALRRDLAFLSRNPSALFQCLWNSCWWHDCDQAADYYEQPQNGWGPDGPPWKPRFSWQPPREEPKLSSLLEAWRDEKEQSSPGFVWLRSLRPLPQRLGLATRTLFHGPPVVALGCSADGKWIATAGGHSVKIWHARTGKGHQSFEVGNPGPTWGEVSEDSFENADGEGTQDQPELSRLARGTEETAGCVAWSLDGSRVIVGTGHSFSVYDVVNDRHTLSLKISIPRGLVAHGIEPCAAFSPDGKRIALATASSRPQVINAVTGQTVFELGHQAVSRLSYSPEGSKIVTLGQGLTEDLTAADRLPTFDYSVCIWDAVTGLELLRQPGVRFADYSKDARRLLLATLLEIVVYDVITWSEVARHTALQTNDDRSAPLTAEIAEDITKGTTIPPGSLRLETMALSPDGRRFAVMHGGNVRVWETDTGAHLACHAMSFGEPTAIEFLPPNLEDLAVPGESFWQASNPEVIIPRLESLGRLRLVCGFSDGTAHIWDAENPGHTPRLRRSKGDITGLTFSPDGERLATAAYDLCLLEATTGREIHRGDGGTFVIFDQEGRRVASDHKRGLQIWDVSDGNPGPFILSHTAWITCAAFSPDGLRLATGGEDYADDWSGNPMDHSYVHVVRIWDLQSGKEILSIPAHEGKVLSVAFSPDGGRIATGGDNDDLTLKLWDALTGELIARFEFMPGSGGIYVQDLAFSPDGQRIAFRCGAGLRMLDAQSGEPVAEFWTQGDSAAWVAGFARFPWLALWRFDEEQAGEETVVLSAVTGHKVAQFPPRLTLIATHPNGRIFAGSFGCDVYLFQLEGEEGLSQ